MSLAGLVVSVAALSLILSVMDGFGKSIQERILSRSSHLTLREKEGGPKLDGYSSFLPSDLQRQILRASRAERRDVLLKTDDGFFGAVAKGYQNVSSRLSRLGLYKYQGALPKPSPSALSIFISAPLAYNLGLYEGASLWISPVEALLLPPLSAPPLKRAWIQGVARRHALSDEERLSFFYERGSLRFSGEADSFLELQLQNPESFALYLPYLRGPFRAEHWAERNSSLLFALKMEKLIMALFISLAIIISLSGVSVSLSLLAEQKRKEIGALRAFGLPAQDSARLFERLGLLLSSAGILGGLVLAGALTAAFQYGQWNILPEIYLDRSLPALFQPLQYGAVAMGALASAFGFCRLSCRHLTKMRALELLKGAP